MFHVERGMVVEFKEPIKTLQYEVDWRKRDIKRLNYFIKIGKLPAVDLEKNMNEIKAFQLAIKILRTHS